MAMFRPNIQRLVASGNVDGLIKAAEYHDPEIRRNAVAALGRIRDRSVFKTLIDALQDDSQSVRIEAIIALGKIRDPSFVNSLQWSLNDSDITVRMNAIWALGQLGGRDVIKPLILSMADNDKQVRIRAVETVTSLGNIAIAELRKAIHGRNQLIRQNVINVLGKLKKADLVPEIIRSLDDPVITVRENAMWALGTIGDPRAVPSLEKLNTPRARKSLKIIKEGPHWRTIADNYEKAGRYEDAARLHEMKSEWEEAGRLRNKAKEPIPSNAIPQILANNINLTQETIIRDSIISRSRIGKGSQAQDSVIHRSNIRNRDLREAVVRRSGDRSRKRFILSDNDGDYHDAGDDDEYDGAGNGDDYDDAGDNADHDGAGDDGDDDGDYNGDGDGDYNDAGDENPRLEDEGSRWIDDEEEDRLIPDDEQGVVRNGSHRSMSSRLRAELLPDRDRSSNRAGNETPKRTADGYQICPFCGMELKFDRAPNFCPYCAEPL